MATFSNKDRKTYQNFCHLSEQGVLSLMKYILSNKYEKQNIIATPLYVIAIGDIPVALVAHADTVFKRPPSLENFYYDQEKNVIWNPDGAGADDRAGIFAIHKILSSTKLRPHIIITTGEESGCIGSGKLITSIPKFPADLRFMIQLDRRGHNDAVYYDCDNMDFEDFITPYGFETKWGSFTDISVLAPAWKVAAVNFSIGYIDEHHEIERLHVDWMYETIEKTIRILNDVKTNIDSIPVYKYIEAKRYFKYNSHWYAWDVNSSLPEGYDYCVMCNTCDKTENMIPVWYKHGVAPHNICLDCYPDVVHQVVWCKTCNRGYFLSKQEADAIKDVNNWVCEDCENGRVYRSSEKVQSSTGVQSGSQSCEHGSNIPRLESEQSSIHGYDEWDDLRAGYTSDI